VTGSPAPTLLRHNAVELALHELRPGRGQPLVLLHGLGEHTPPVAPAFADAWPGPVHGLDFTGHGRSTVPLGGGYTAELLLADVDIVLAHLGPSTLVGRGLGAYIALLAAGARPQLVRGAVLCDGPGLTGGGPTPPSIVIVSTAIAVPHPSAPDPFALVELARDVRPADYASSFVHLAVQLSGLAEPLAVTTIARPPWLEAALRQPGVAETTVVKALGMYRAPTGPSPH
jgi:pimeloyl-ACP methyl ester carboxylesterase